MLLRDKPKFWNHSWTLSWMRSKAKKEKDWEIGRTGPSTEVKAQGCSGFVDWISIFPPYRQICIGSQTIIEDCCVSRQPGSQEITGRLRRIIFPKVQWTEFEHQVTISSGSIWMGFADFCLWWFLFLMYQVTFTLSLFLNCLRCSAEKDFCEIIVGKNVHTVFFSESTFLGFSSSIR